LKKILIVDDLEDSRDLLTDILQESYEITTASNGSEAIELLNKNADYSLVLLDLMMPEVDGFEVLDYMQANKLMEKHLVIIISGESAAETESRCLEYGVSDFISKPFKAKVVRRRIKNIISLQEYQNSLEGEIERKNKVLERQNKILQEQAARLKETNAYIIDVLGNIVESRNLESGTHVKRVRAYTYILGKMLIKDYPEYALTIDEVMLISQASALHDIGKISIPDHILLKPGKLTPEEFEYMKTHTTKGCDILKQIQGIWDDDYEKTSHEICRYHHERYDGKGYPEGLHGEDIPISAQLVSIADVYDALTTERVYKKAYSKEKAYEMIINGECGQFSPKIIDCFKKARKEFEALVVQA